MRDGVDYAAYERGRECNYWTLDPTLRYEAERIYPDDEFDWAEDVLRQYGKVLGHEMDERSARIDRHPPELHTYDRDGEIQNVVEYLSDQRENGRVTYGEFGMTHDAFHPPPGREEPVGFQHILTMQTLLCYVDVGFACPASMTTGAAIVLDRYDDGGLTNYFERLTSRDPDEHIEGAMFLTEKQGGSDVGANEVRAEPLDDAAAVTPDDADVDAYALYGEKWFCSNIDAQGALALARTPDAPDGVKGLSLFLVPRELPDGSLNEALFRRLKDKLGTKSVPTGEIEYQGATGYLVGDEGEGFRAMSEMMNYERLTNATGAVGLMGRALLEAKIRAADREAFGSVIDEYPLMRRDLVDLTVDYEGAAAFAFEAARQYERRRHEGDDGDAFRLMRLLVPIAKHRTARMSIDVTSYACEVLGGNGAVREWTTPRLFRDAQILPIWEGTSNILSLDVLRALNREDAHEALVPFVSELLEVQHDYLVDLAEEVQAEFVDLQNALVTLASRDGDYAQYHAKELTDYIFDVVAAALLVQEADQELDQDGRKALVAERFIHRHLRDPAARGITSGSRFAMKDDAFEAIAKYATVDPATLTEPAATADD